MGLRFFRSLKVLPGIRINFSKSGLSVSLGRPGATVTLGKQGATASVGLPGTGLSFRQRLLGWRKKAPESSEDAGAPSRVQETPGEQ